MEPFDRNSCLRLRAATIGKVMQGNETEHRYQLLGYSGSWSGDIVLKRSYDAPPPTILPGMTVRDPQMDQDYIVREVKVVLPDEAHTVFAVHVVLDDASVTKIV